MRSALHIGGQVPMCASIAQWRLRSAASLFLSISLFGGGFCARVAAQQASPAPMQLTLDQAINLALKQNHSVRLRSLSVEEMESKKDEARSNYFPANRCAWQHTPHNRARGRPNTRRCIRELFVSRAGTLEVTLYWSRFRHWIHRRSGLGATDHAAVPHPPGKCCSKGGCTRRDNSAQSIAGSDRVASPSALLQPPHQ